MKTTYSTGTVIEAEWLNEVNVAVFDAIGDGTNAPTTGAEVRTNIGAGTGDGDVAGPASSTDNAIVLFDGLTGKTIKDSAVLLSSKADSGANTDITSLGNVASGGVFRKNLLINGTGMINQRQLSSNADDSYAHDRWYVLTQSNPIAVSTVSNAENTTPYMMRLTQSNASAQRMGYAQIVESANCIHLRGQQVTFRVGRLRLSTSANIRMAVLEWTGTADSVTSDVVNDWTSSTYTAGNFFIGSNLTITNTTQQALTANTLTTGTSITVTLGSSFTNLIVFVWTESTVAQNVTLDIAKAQLEFSAVATTFEVPRYQAELYECRRYCIQYNSDGTVYVPFQPNGMKYTTTAIIAFGPWLNEMRSAPTVTTSAVTDLYVLDVNGTPVQGIGAFTTNNLTKYAGNIQFTTTTTLGGGAGDATSLLLGPGSGKFLRIDAEL